MDKESRMKIAYLLLVLVVAILAVMFAAQNGATVAITFFSWSTSGSLSLVLIVTLTIGILMGLLIMAPSVFKRSFQSSGLKRRLHRLEKEKTSLNEKASSTEREAPDGESDASRSVADAAPNADKKPSGKPASK
jgi:uncharacterized integral membrane protein